MSQRLARLRWALWAAGTPLVVLAVLLVGTQAGAVLSFDPIFQFMGISNSAPNANGNITFRTTVPTTAPAGHQTISSHNFQTPNDSWGIAGSSGNGNVTAVGTMTVNLDPDGNCSDGDSGSPQNYGPFRLNDRDTGGDHHAEWGRPPGTTPQAAPVITDFGDGNPNTYWDLTIFVDPTDISAWQLLIVLTDHILPAGNPAPVAAKCAPQVFTLTMCGRANPLAATSCGSGSNPVVMTNPAAAGCYLWRLEAQSDSGLDPPLFAVRQAGVSIGGTPCPDTDGDGVTDAGDNCPTVPNPDQSNINPADGLGDACDPDDFDVDGYSDRVEYFAGTDRGAKCATNPTHNAWPADLNNDGYSDITDLGGIASSFGQSVPPASHRHNIAPDPPDTFVDISDMGSVGSWFGQSCLADLDGDNVPDLSDNCPTVPNPDQLNINPADGVGDACDPDDFDLDTFSDRIEYFVGTDRGAPCAANPSHNAWPADINNDRFSDITDLGAVASSFGQAVPPAPARHNVAPDPPDGFADITDLARIASHFGEGC